MVGRTRIDELSSAPFTRFAAIITASLRSTRPCPGVVAMAPPSRRVFYTDRCLGRMPLERCRTWRIRAAT